MQSLSTKSTASDKVKGIFLHLVKLAPATAPPSFMVRKIRRQTHLSHGGLYLPEPADRACSHLHQTDLVFISGLLQRNPHMDSKHFTVYLITIQIVLVLVWMRFLFLFFFFASKRSTRRIQYDPCVSLAALDQVDRSASVGITHQSGKHW